MTPTRCHPGQLAKVISSFSPVNLRRLVYVVERCYPDAQGWLRVAGADYDSEGYQGVIWVVEAIGEPLYVGSPIQYARLAPAKDTSLEPLPDLDPETETTEKELTV